MLMTVSAHVCRLTTQIGGGKSYAPWFVMKLHHYPNRFELMETVKMKMRLSQKGVALQLFLTQNGEEEVAGAMFNVITLLESAKQSCK